VAPMSMTRSFFEKKALLHYDWCKESKSLMGSCFSRGCVTVLLGDDQTLFGSTKRVRIGGGMYRGPKPEGFGACVLCADTGGLQWPL
jgi:hypothetical protein